jgi:hypothetical protein
LGSHLLLHLLKLAHEIATTSVFRFLWFSSERFPGHIELLLNIASQTDSRLSDEVPYCFKQDCVFISLVLDDKSTASPGGEEGYSRINSDV